MKAFKRMLRRFIREYRSNLCCKHRNAAITRYEANAIVDVFGTPHYRGRMTLECQNCGHVDVLDDIIFSDRIEGAEFFVAKELARDFEDACD